MRNVSVMAANGGKMDIIRLATIKMDDSNFLWGPSENEKLMVKSLTEKTVFMQMKAFP